MIKRLYLNNFKCFTQTELELENLTILAGANAAGKSSVIQALILASKTNQQLIGKNAENVIVDVNDIFGFSVGAPRALVSQNPIGEEPYDFSISLEVDEQLWNYYYTVDQTSPLELRAEGKNRNQAESIQYLNAERVAPRVANQVGKSDGITYNGENAGYLVEIADHSNRCVAGLIKKEASESGKFSVIVENWMGAILGDLQLTFHTDYNKATTEMWIKNTLVDHAVVPTLTGFGISYVLPIVVAGIWATGEERSILVLENPEAHLHPCAQSNIGKFLAILAKCGVQVIVETHSEHIIDGSRYQMAKMGCTDQMIVNFMENDGKAIKQYPIKVRENGELSAWPKGFFDQKQMDLRDIMRLRKKDV